MKSIWKGHIRFSLVTIPIAIYGAIETAESIRFNQLHKKDNGPIGYDKKCKRCKTVVKSEDIVKGYKYEPDQYVIIEKEDFEKIKLKSTKIIEIEGFVKAKEIHPTLFDAPYFAGPDGEVASKAYALLCQTLKESGKVGIGRVVLREKESVMMMTPHDGGLLLYRLRYPNEIRKMKDVPLLEGLEADDEQLKLARTLVDSMSTTMSKIKLKDRYNDALKEMILAKIEGKEIVTVAEEEQPVVDIMTALKESIDQAKTQKKPMKKATGKTKKIKRPLTKRTTKVKKGQLG